MTGAGLVYGSSSQEGDILATSPCLVRDMTPDMGLDMLNVGSSWKRVSFRLHIPSVCGKNVAKSLGFSNL